jgi:hypothetical protein
VIAPTGLSLDADGDPQPACVLMDLDGPLPDNEVIGSATAVVVGVACRPPSPEARVRARELACSFAPTDSDVGVPFIPVDDPVAAADELYRAIVASPRSAMSLARLLRLTADAPVTDGLAAESAVYSMLLAAPEFARWLAERRPPRPARQTRPAVLITRQDGVLAVTMNRPDRHNAFDRFVRDGLVDALDLAIADPTVRRVDLRGEGPSFCSGGDLAEFGTSADVSTAHLVRLDRSVAARVHHCRDRVVAHLHGACIGAGIEIPSFAGQVIARQDTTIRLPELGMGLVPGAGGTVGLPRRIGRWRTAYLALSGATLDPWTARKWGLVDAISDD